MGANLQGPVPAEMRIAPYGTQSQEAPLISIFVFGCGTVGPCRRVHHVKNLDGRGQIDEYWCGNATEPTLSALNKALMMVTPSLGCSVENSC